jgi:hypothetical protein
MRTNRLRWVALQSVILLGLSTSVTLPALAKNGKDMVDAAASAWVCHSWFTAAAFSAAARRRIC